MRGTDIIKMMREKRPPEGLNSEALSELCEKYPYCSGFQVLRAIASKSEDRISQSDDLARAAIAIQDRSKLYDHLMPPEIPSPKDPVSNADEELIGEPPGPAKKEKISGEQPAETQPSPLPAAGDGESKPHSDLGNAANPTSGAEDDDVSPIPKDPLEKQVMQEALMQLGALEADRGLTETAKEPSFLSPQPEPEVVAPPETPKSLGDWLLSLEGEKAPDDDRQNDLIAKFIHEEPQITPVKKAFFSSSQMGKMSLVEDEGLITETLAKIYEKQGHFAKAARAYANLALKYPEKSLYFADLQKQAEEKLKK